jgi:PRTRC genetic system protein B
MFFGGIDQEARKISGLVFPHPALIFKVAGRDLFVRAVATSSRPGPETPTKTASYWNTDSRGLVCAGSMRVPESSDTASMPAWQDAYFQSQLTHAAGAVRLTSHPGVFIGLWKGFAGRKRFPVQYLIDAGETLQEFVARGSER